jgi:hypothetical protein
MAELRFEIGANLSELRFAPVLGRRTFYGSVKFGSRTFWLMRWDTNRCTKETPFAYSSDRLMCWTAGTRSV